ncbi:hypothetical protein H5119_20065 [Pseudoalteromonas sp. SG45-5]|uniref:hypothetical protein n=1 Tax=unclassified Pseudoalteromonas TaxID=194690 RepID=UPI0015F983F5|nr:MULTISPECIES: hypothetical protein [unclassified Pseudoalteromonas]MBB1387775.1 hypothetical protein [Pseudoalteromonas sp. SG45-5]MBB1395997.1 hypothetical protein [Pseudoalteromonas sp. SG44-4]
MNKLSISEAANKHVTIDFNDYDNPKWSEAEKILEVELSFDRIGNQVAGIDEGIFPSFIKDDIKIDAGWDNWSGCYLLSTSKQGDELLKQLAVRLSK